MEEFKRKKFGAPKKKRKPMTEEQKVAAAERLAKAREAKGTPKHKNIHPSILAKPDDHFISLKKVRQWIKTQKGIASSERKRLAQSAGRRRWLKRVEKMKEVRGY